MGRCVMISGIMMIHQSSAHNLDFLVTVQDQHFEILKISSVLLLTGSVNVSATPFFSEGINPALLSSVSCSGSEEEILDCNHVQSTHGLFCEPAGVVCQSKLVNNV